MRGRLLPVGRDNGGAGVRPERAGSEPLAPYNKRVRRILLIASLASGLWAQDAAEIVRRAVAADSRNAELQRTYTYRQREETRELDSSGKDKRVSIRTVEIRMMDGSPYRRLVARNDRPLSPEEQKLEDDKARFNLEQRDHETPAARERRIAEWRKREDKRREPLREVPDAYNFKPAGEETVNGAACWVIEATPKAGYKPKSTASAVLPALSGRIWVAKQDYGWVKTEMEAHDSFTMGGFLLRLSKGSRIVIEQGSEGGGVWLPKLVEIQFSARLLLVKSLREDLKFGFSDYRKPETEARAAGTQR